MTTWTTSGKQEFNRYFDRAQPALAAAGADASEVRDDLRRHLEEEALAYGLSVLTEHDVRSLLARIGAPEPDGSPPAELAASPSPAPNPVLLSPPSRTRPSLWLLLGGAVLPLITVAVELVTGMCAGAFFDPIPTSAHLLLLALVPLANAVTWQSLAHGTVARRRWLGWLNGAAFGVCLFYSILFLPLLLPGLLAVIVYGWGLLPLTPLLALIATVYLRNALRSAALDGSPHPPRGFWCGWGLAWLAIALLDAPVWMTRVALAQAAAEDSSEQRRGLRWLRAWGHEETLRRACYGQTRGAARMDLIGWLITGARPLSPERAREVYYRVTGHPFNSVPAPHVRTARGPFAELNDWTWDPDQGGDRVGGRVKGLSLQSSRLDAVVEADAALAYFEWILEFRNESARPREARAQIQLPAGGVVSRLTLWIDGEEREAAFAGRAQVRRAYEQVAVRQRRDPVLVTTCGPDRVLMQCFPVPPDGGVMRVRLGVTAPLVLESPAQGRLSWPGFLERNFTIDHNFRHSLWIEGRGEFEPVSSVLRREQPKPGSSAARGQVTDSELTQAATTLRVRRDPSITTVWTRNTRSADGGVVTQRIAETTAAPLARVILVVDGSVEMAETFPQIAAALEAFAGSAGEIALLIAGAEAGYLAAPAPLDANRLATFARELANWRPTGGEDNVPALLAAWDLAAEKPGSAILWIHGPQPILLSSVEPLRQACERRGAGPLVFDLQTVTGPNRVLEQLDGIAAVRSVPRLGSVEADLRQLAASWRLEAKQFQAVRERVANAPAAAADTREVSAHLARLWARDEARRLHAARQTGKAVQLASDFQIVTPVSGAVVLETQQQYAQHGLHPADPTTVPAVPEPGTRPLLGLGLLLFLALRGRRRAPDGRHSGRARSEGRAMPQTQSRDG